jgi:hypothetical protein
MGHFPSAPQGKESRDWKEYAYQTVWYAFGETGDVDIAEFRPSPERIPEFHKSLPFAPQSGIE